MSQKVQELTREERALRAKGLLKSAKKLRRGGCIFGESDAIDADDFATVAKLEALIAPAPEQKERRER